MTDRELRSLNRRELLELLVEQEKESEVLRTELQQAQDELKKKQLNTSDYGMTSESALAMSNIYAQADSAAAMYLETVRQRAADAQAEYDSLIAEAQSKADEILAAARIQAGLISMDNPSVGRDASTQDTSSAPNPPSAASVSTQATSVAPSAHADLTTPATSEVPEITSVLAVPEVTDYSAVSAEPSAPPTPEVPASREPSAANKDKDHDSPFRFSDSKKYISEVEDRLKEIYAQLGI